jgi:uncharacterized membrane protein (UPF0127 family)
MNIQIGSNVVNVQVAQGLVAQSIGLGHRTMMGANDGMLFIFQQSKQQCFEMKDTMMPLTAAFINESGVIVGFADMKAKSTTPYCSPQPVRYVLQLHQGWFAQHQVAPGTKLSASGG